MPLAFRIHRQGLCPLLTDCSLSLCYTKKPMSQVILASQSPRRKELLAKMGVEFTVVASDFDEQLDESRSPETIAKELALGKAMAVAKHNPSSIVIGSDTIVAIDGKQLGKPDSLEEAKEILKLLSGRSHSVITGVAVVNLSANITLTGADAASVLFRPYSEALVNQYLATGDYKDKAAAYGIQSGAAPLIEYFVGNYDTIVGLPTSLLAELLSSVGVKARAVKLSSPVTQR